MIPFSANSSRFFEKKVAQGLALSDFFGSLLYHTKNYQGTTTPSSISVYCPVLYHTKNYQGTTTWEDSSASVVGLYHTKNYQGTTTIQDMTEKGLIIIPYQELPGNYNSGSRSHRITVNYTIPRTTRELQPQCLQGFRHLHYTIPRTTRELQHISNSQSPRNYYTIPRTTRELQPRSRKRYRGFNYTIPRTTWQGLPSAAHRPATDRRNAAFPPALPGRMREYRQRTVVDYP